MQRIAITPDKSLEALLPYLLTIQHSTDGVILRLNRPENELKAFLKRLFNQGFDQNKLIIHSSVSLIEHFNLSRIHFRQGDKNAYQLKASRPDLTVSMAVHSNAACLEAKNHNLDFGLYSHLFPTPSKPDLAPRTNREIEEALAVGLPLIALGGITADTIDNIPPGFIGYAGIRLFKNLKEDE